MRKVLLLFLIAVFLFSCASMEELPNDQRVYQKIVETDIEGNELFELTNMWMSTSLENWYQESTGQLLQRTMVYNANRGNKSAELGVSYISESQGVIVGTGLFGVNYSFTPVDTLFTLKAEIKDNRVRFTFDQIRINGRTEITNRGQLESFSETAESMIGSFIEELNNTDSSW